MQTLKEFMIANTKTSNRSQLLADVITRIADYKFGSAFKFIDNFDMLDEDIVYTMSLYRDTLSEKAIGINWSTEDQLASVSYWNDYAGSPLQPTKEILFNENYDADTVKPVFSAALDRLLSCKEDKKLLESVDFLDGLPLTEASADENEEAQWAAFIAKVKAKQKKNAEAKRAAMIDPKTKVPIHYADPQHVFADLEASIKSLVQGSGFNAVLIAGPGGTGKSYHVEKALNESGMKAGIDWVKYKVRMTPAQIYLSLLKNDDKIIIFDDCDEALINKTSANIFKAALDTTEHRYVSWYKTDTLDTTGLPNEVIKGLAANDKKGRLPSTFEFTGSVIFITNLPVSKIEPALLTRCDVVDVTFKRDDMGEIIRSQLANVKIPAHIRATGEVVNIGTNEQLKEEVLNFLLSPEYKAHMKKYNMPLNFRLFQRAYTFAYNDPTSWKRRMFNVYY